MDLGYARSSVDDPELKEQLEALRNYNCGYVFQDMNVEKVTKKEVQNLINNLNKGDSIVVCRFDRITNSIREMINLSVELEKREINFVSIEENVDTRKDNSFYHVMRNLYKFEQDIKSEKVKIGLKKSRARGRNGGRPKVINNKVAKALEMYDSREYTIEEIVNETNVSQATLYRRIKEREEKNSDS